jgi:hypothetical protein
MIDDLDATMAFLRRRTSSAAPALGLLPAWKPVTLLGAGAADCGGS